MSQSSFREASRNGRTPRAPAHRVEVPGQVRHHTLLLQVDERERRVDVHSGVVVDELRLRQLIGLRGRPQSVEHPGRPSQAARA